MQAWTHTTVLLAEAVDALVTRPAGCYVDATFGRGGHSRAILERLGPAGRLIAFDKDPEAMDEAARMGDARFECRHASFTALGALAPASADGVLMDLGVSSPQIDNPARGFSLRADGPLDMRMDPTRGTSAAQWLAEAAEEDIARVIRDFGEERFARAIARAIAARRQQKPLTGTAELAQLVAGAVKTREPGQHPATRTFQALRVAVNDELTILERALPRALASLRVGGRLVVEAYQSLEDRIVKDVLRRGATSAAPPGLPIVPDEMAPSLRLLTKGANRADQAEQDHNPRSASVRLRGAELIREWKDLA